MLRRVIARRRASAVGLVLLVGAIAWLALRNGDDSQSRPTLPPLTLAQLAGQRVVVSFRAAGAGRIPSGLVRRIRAGTVGSVILFTENGHTVASVRRLTNKLQAIPRPAGLRMPLLVMIDQEGGAIRRLTDAPPRMNA